jgi:hypothetical protein
MQDERDDERQEGRQDDGSDDRSDDGSDDRQDDRIDFSALDPAANELRWARMVDGVVDRALAERRRRLSIEYQLLRWARPVLAVAAGLCIVAWTAGFLTGNRSAQTVASETPAALSVARWAANNQIPEPGDLFGTLRGN